MMNFRSCLLLAIALAAPTAASAQRTDPVYVEDRFNQLQQSITLLAGNAQYWLGESYYARRDYQNAMAAFAEGYKVYKASPKGPDNLLKLGITLAVLGRKADACAVFAKFNQDYPRATDLQKRRIDQERQKNSCG